MSKIQKAPGIRHIVTSSHRHIDSRFTIHDLRSSLAASTLQRFNASTSERAARAFTILELLVVIAIIIALAGLILATSGYVQKKGARSRAEAEIAAMSAACESYKADNGIYPRGNAAQPGTGSAPFDTDNLDARKNGDPSSNTYKATSLYLIETISGINSDGSSNSAFKSYISFKPNQLARPDMSQPPSGSNKIYALRDPFGNSYGYSTAFTYDSESSPGSAPSHGYNPTFDLWSTGGVVSTTSPPDQSQWLKNW